MSEQELPEWLKGPEVTDEIISSIELAVYYHEGKMPEHNSPLEWAETMLHAAQTLVEAYKEYVEQLKNGEGGKTL